MTSKDDGQEPGLPKVTDFWDDHGSEGQAAPSPAMPELRDFSQQGDGSGSKRQVSQDGPSPAREPYRSLDTPAWQEPENKDLASQAGDLGDSNVEQEDLVTTDEAGSTRGSGYKVKVALLAGGILGFFFLARQALGSISLYLLFCVLLCLAAWLLLRLIARFASDAVLWPLWRALYILLWSVAVIYFTHWAFFRSAVVTLQTNRINNETTLESTFTLHFSKPIHKKDLQQFLTIQPSISTKLSWGDSILDRLPYGTQVEIISDNILQPNSEYEIAVSGLQDIFGRRLKNENFTVVTSSALPEVIPDTQEDTLTVMQSIPQQGSIDVDLDLPLTLTFSETVQSGTFHMDLEPDATTQTEWNQEATRIVIKPVGAWQSETTYILTVSKGLTSAAGIQLSSDFVLRFTTLSRLRVVSTTPRDGVFDVPIDTDIMVAFNQPIPPGLLDTVWSIAPETNGSLDVQGANTIFSPSRGLLYDTPYTVTIRKELVSESGTNLEKDFVFNFHTVADPAKVPVPGDTGDTKPKNDSVVPPTIPEIVSPSSAPISDSGWSEQSDLEQALIDQLNEQRDSRSQTTLTSSAALTEVARAYSLDLAQHGYQGGNHQDSLGKDTKQRLAEQGIHTDIFTEAIYAYTAFSVPDVLSIWTTNVSRLLTVDYKSAGCVVLSSDDSKYITVLLVASW